jgi:hypothetical protein
MVREPTESYMVLRGGAHYPQIWGAPDQGIAGDELGPHDQVLEIKTPTKASPMKA